MRPLLLLVILFGSCSADVVGTLTHCCNHGLSLAQSSKPCGQHSGPIAGIPRQQQSICQTTSSVCCLRQHRLLMCQAGVLAARRSQLCVVIQGINVTGSEYYKDCCDACKLGIAVRGHEDVSQCDLNNFDLGYPWNHAFTECCHSTTPTNTNFLIPISTATGGATTGSPAPAAGTTTTTAAPPRDADREYAAESGAVGRHQPAVANRSEPSVSTTTVPSTSDNVNECSLYPVGQLCSHLCVDTAQGYHCDCYGGYTLHSDGQTCVPASDRCSINNPCQQVCSDTGDSVVCSCHAGFELQNDERTCKDIDECQFEDEDACDITHELCVNTVGSFDCISRQDSGQGGGHRDGRGHANVTTHYTPTACPQGYEFSPLNGDCKDIDECALGMDNCDRGTQFCSNTLGSYSCFAKQTITTCPPGYKYNSLTSTCIDVNECAEGIAKCNPEREFCLNLQGTYECQPRTQSSCPAGYKFNAALKTCEDIDECEENLYDCDKEKEQCRNVVGAYDCDEKCEQGFRFHLALRTCNDIDECEENLHNCKTDGETCQNTMGSYQCTTKHKAQCQAGFKPGSRGGQCVDVDECDENVDTCDREMEICVNDVGLYHCQPKDIVKACPDGYHIDPDDPQTCNDIDECEEELDDCDKKKAVCINTLGSFRCHVVNCPHGYVMNLSSRVCQDVNECLENRHNCTSDTEECVNLVGGFRCRLLARQVISCPVGHIYNATIRQCEDVNECDTGKHNCPSHAKCLNYPGGFTCSTPPTTTTPAPVPVCQPGYRIDPSSKQCKDVNECLENSHNCDLTTSECVNTEGRFMCNERPRCPSGFRYSIENRQCLDVDECAENSHTCRINLERCYNTRGSHRCLPQRPPNPTTTTTTTTTTSTARPTTTVTPVTLSGGGRGGRGHGISDSNVVSNSLECPVGFKFSEDYLRCVDVNECQVGSHSCLASQRCDNTIGSFTCIRLTGCGTGYTLNAHLGKCEDDDECEIGNHNCGTAYQCHNTLGSFRCLRKTCPYGYRLISNGTCVPTDCGVGMRPNAEGSCVDIDECENVNICRTNQQCVNSHGSYRCQNLVNCGPGYELDTYGSRCQDIDECALRTHNCSGGQQCINQQGSYVCQCPLGHTRNNQGACEDIDECSRYGKVCAHNSVCQNSPGSYSCACRDGFSHGDNDKTCIDVDECKQFENVCQHSCINTWGSYQCTCLPGYSQGDDKRTCSDVDECTLYKGRGNLCIGYCVNEPGSYSCSCPNGYKLSADKRTCQDIDECAQGNVCLGENELCLNTKGSYKCNQIQCPPSYFRDQTHKNRCKRESTICVVNDEKCIKQPLSYSYNYLTFVSNLPIPPTGHVNLFTLRGPHFQDIVAEFTLDLSSVRAPQGLESSTREFFNLKRTSTNQAVVSLVRSIAGPQEIELNLSMNLYKGNTFGGSAVARIYIYVSEHEF